MSLQSDHKALLFLAAVATLGAGVRVVRAAGRDAPSGAQPALEHQMQAADSAARAGRGGSGRGAKAKKKSPARAAGDTAKRRTPHDSTARQTRGPLDRPGWVGGKLDLDVATAAQLDSLPGVTPLMAKRIVADRMAHGPFLNRQRLQRVPGAGPRFIARIDTLITFSGTFSRPAPTDTIIERPKSARSRKSAPAPP